MRVVLVDDYLALLVKAMEMEDTPEYEELLDDLDYMWYQLTDEERTAVNSATKVMREDGTIEAFKRLE